MTLAELPRVLLWVENPQLRVDLVEILCSAFEAGAVASADEALAELARRPPQAVVLDVDAPASDCLALCARLHAGDRTAGLPIVVLAAFESDQEVEQALAAGATDWVPKPINARLLCHRLSALIQAATVEDALALSEKRLREAQRVVRMASWNWTRQTGRVRCTQSFSRLFGVNESLLGDQLDAVVPYVHPDDREIFAEALEGLRAGHPYRLEYRALWPDGSVHTLSDTAVAEVDGQGEVVGAHGTVQDVTEQVAAERRVRHLAYFDELTGMPNRNAFREALEAMLIGARDRGAAVAVALLDLRRFGLLNDSLGRDAADQVLRLVSARVRDFARLELGAGDVTDDTELAVAARYGSDQFAVMLCEGVGACPREPLDLVSRLLEQVSAPLHVQRHALVMKCSVGMALFPDHAADAESLLKCAETTLRQAKRDPSRSLVLQYSKGMLERQLSRIRLESAMRGALELGHGLSLRYQPKVDLAERRIVGAEALLRWQDPALGHVSPADFIPFAEDIGMIVPLSEWVIDAVCRQVAEWREQDLPRRPVAINLSALHFRFADFLDTIVRSLATHGLDGRDIEFELTESALMGDLELCSQILAEMHSRGLRVAVDDFGTGYSSLAYLKRFPLAALKIDRSFVRDIATDPSDAAIVSSVVAMANSLGMGVVVEGVESAEQARLLARIGCNVMQGSHFALPLRPDQYAEALRRGPAPWVGEQQLAG